MTTITLKEVTEGYTNTKVGSGITAKYIPTDITATTVTITYGEGESGNVPSNNASLYTILDDLITKYER
jgi:hypothetical protein